jgi:hypothetical protein
VVQGLADIREMLSYQSNTVTLRNQDEHGLVDDISSEIRKAFSSWPLNQLQSTFETELRKGIETTIATVAEQDRQQQSTASTAIGEAQLECKTLLQRYRNRIAVSRCSITKPMVLGEVHYESTAYRITSNLTTASEKDEGRSKEQLEVETSFSFVPSWWMTKLMAARVVKLDILKLSTQGWQTQIQSFNVCVPHILWETSC